jgi:hypothetical protein
LNIPTPRILAWSLDKNNPVGAVYILEEKAPGQPLSSLWYQWPMKFRLEMISQIVEIEQQLATIKFVESGSIYFKHDIPKDTSSGNALIATNLSLSSSVLERFTLGPLVSSGLWRGDRAGMDMNRGPCKCSTNITTDLFLPYPDKEPLEFVKAMATNEMQLVKKYARPHELPPILYRSRNA